jgi:hypothetical protein
MFSPQNMPIRPSNRPPPPRLPARSEPEVRGRAGGGREREDLLELADRRPRLGPFAGEGAEGVERGIGSEGRQHAVAIRGDAAVLELATHAIGADLVHLVECDQRLAVQFRGHARRLEQPGQQAPMIDPDDEVGEPEPLQHVRHRGTQLGFHHHRFRSDGVDVALIELAEPAARRPIGAPHRLNLIPLEEPRQLAPMLGHHPCQRHRQVVAQRQIGLAGRLVLAAAQHLENQLVAFFAVLAGEGLDVLERRRFERLEAVAPVGLLDDGDDVFAAANVLREKVPHPARGPN